MMLIARVVSFPNKLATTRFQSTRTRAAQSSNPGMATTTVEWSTRTIELPPPL